MNQRLGLGAAGAPTLASLSRLYASWCLAVPFDNARKLLCLLGAAPGGEISPVRGLGPLPGAVAADFFAGFLADGTGGTCWPSSNALFELLRSHGFAARRISASMMDLGVENHGSIKVAIAGRDYLVDSSMLMREPLPLDLRGAVDLGEPGYRVEIGGDAEKGLLIQFPGLGGFGRPCRLLADPVDLELYQRRYEASRRSSPFNRYFFGHRCLEDGRVIWRGRQRVRWRAGEARQRTVEDDDLETLLVDDFAYSRQLAARLAGADIWDVEAADG